MGKDLERIDRRTFIRRAGIGAAGLGVLGSSGLLTACGGQGGGSQGGGSGGGQGGLAPYSNKSLAFFFFVTQAAAVQRQTKKLGYDYQSTNADSDASQQTQDWQSFLVKSPKFIISDPIDSEGLVPMVKRYNQRNIPVGIIDTPITGGDGKLAFQVAFDNFEGGRLAARRLVDEIEKVHGERKGKVLNCYGALSSSAWSARKDGFEAEMKKNPGIEIISRPNDGLQEQARGVTDQVLAQFPDIRGAHAPSDSLTLGVLQSMKSKNRLKKVGKKGHIVTTSIDGEPMSLHWLREKLIDAEVSQDPIAYGEICVQMLGGRVAQGKKLPTGDYKNDRYAWKTATIKDEKNGPNMVIPAYFIDQSNVDDPRQWGNRAIKEYGLNQNVNKL